MRPRPPGPCRCAWAAWGSTWWPSPATRACTARRARAGSWWPKGWRCRRSRWAARACAASTRSIRAGMPESLEAGTLNAHGIAGLAAGVAFVERVGADAVAARMRALVARFEDGVRAIDGVRVVGGRGGIDRCGIVAVVRGGGRCRSRRAHACTPISTSAPGRERTAPRSCTAPWERRSAGAVRFSFSQFHHGGRGRRGGARARLPGARGHVSMRHAASPRFGHACANKDAHQGHCQGKEPFMKPSMSDMYSVSQKTPGPRQGRNRP